VNKILSLPEVPVEVEAFDPSLFRNW